MPETTTKEIDNLVYNNTKEELAEMIVSEKRRVSSYKGHLNKARADAIAFKRISESLNGESVAELKDQITAYRTGRNQWKRQAKLFENKSKLLNITKEMHKKLLKKLQLRIGFLIPYSVLATFVAIVALVF